MTTTNVLHRTFSLFTSSTLLLGFTCALVPVFSMANQTVAPPTPVSMNEAAPPWQANPTGAQASAAPAVEQAAVGGSSVENWYRNRRKTADVAGNELATLQAAAQSGDAKAQYKLAMAYRKDDDSSPAKLKQSLEWQQKAAQAGYVEAQYGLGLLYANGQYVTADNQQAREWFQKAADQGHVAARLALLSLNNGASAQAIASAPAIEEVPREVATPVEISQAETVAPPALKPKVTIPVVDSASQPEPAISKVSMPMPEADSAPEQEAANDTGAAGAAGASGNAGASASLDMTGIEPAVLRQSAEAGDKQAQLMLGTMYEDGIGGLPSDLREAAYWYEQAAKQNYPKAQYNLGLLYEDGRGVNQNYNQAAYWYAKAAKAGFAEAQNNLGVLYVLGNGVKKDSKKAETLFSDAVSQGNADAQRNLDMLRKG